MLNLKTFGGLSVDVDGAPARGAGQQRKTLALLALLAAAGRRGLSRDKLTAYLWPESDAERGRGVLKQTCYALRRDLHAPELFLGTFELRLNPNVIASDIASFQDGLDRGDLAAAVAAYDGAFLDGFYLPGNDEFERWAEETRVGLKGRVIVALESLAKQAGSAGDYAAAAGWWRRLAGLDPFDSEVAVSLMEALAASGDRVGALEFARVHEALLREEVDAEPDGAVIELVARLQAESRPSPGPEPPEDAAVRGESVVVAGRAPGERSGISFLRRASGRLVALVSALILGVGLTGGWLLLAGPFGARRTETANEPKRLVVLPFVNLGTEEDEYFADGISEEITARLVAMRDLRVIGSTSAQAYKDTKATITEIGRELEVDYVLEGSVRFQKGVGTLARVRVTPQLVSTADGTHLWAEVYDEPLDEIFRVQSEIAERVVQALDVSLLAPERGVVNAAPTRNLEAYDYYLRGRDYMRRSTGDAQAARAAVRMYEKAVELDTSFALAYAMLSRMHSRFYLFYYDRSAERLAMAKRAVERALALEPGLPEAHHSLAAYYFLGRHDYDRALREFATVEASRPDDAELFLARGVLRVRQGKYREALADHEKAWRLDPRSHLVANQYAQVYDLLRDFARADSLYDRAIELAPDRAALYFHKMWLYLRWDGTTERARAVLDEAREAGVADEMQVRFTEVMTDLFDRLYEDLIRRLPTQAPEVIRGQARFVPRAQLLAQVYGLVGRHDLERAYYDSARAYVTEQVEEWPEDARLRGALGIAYAGLGRTEGAIQEGERGVALLPVSVEAYQGYYRVLDLARIYTMIGEYDAAIDRLEYLLSIPGHLTSAWLRADPTWDPLRGQARFQKLVGRGK